MQVIRLATLQKQLVDMWWEALPKNDDGNTIFMNGELLSTERADVIREIIYVIENQEKIEVNELGK